MNSMAALAGLDFRVGSSTMKTHYDTIAGNYARFRESDSDNIEKLCLGIHLKGMEEYQAYLDLIPVSNDSVKVAIPILALANY